MDCGQVLELLAAPCRRRFRVHVQDARLCFHRQNLEPERASLAGDPWHVAGIEDLDTIGARPGSTPRQRAGGFPAGSESFGHAILVRKVADPEHGTERRDLRKLCCARANHVTEAAVRLAQLRACGADAGQPAGA
jgi:hypothetical protein